MKEIFLFTDLFCNTFCGGNPEGRNLSFRFPPSLKEVTALGQLLNKASGGGGNSLPCGTMHQQDSYMAMLGQWGLIVDVLQS